MLSDLIPLRISLISCRFSSWRLVLIIFITSVELLPWWGLYKAQDRAEPSRVWHPGPTPEKRQGTWCRWWRNWKQASGIEKGINEGPPRDLSITHSSNFFNLYIPNHKESLIQRNRCKVEDGGEHSLRQETQPISIQIKAPSLQIKSPHSRYKCCSYFWEQSNCYNDSGHLRDLIGLFTLNVCAWVCIHSCVCYLHGGDDHAAVHDELAESRRAFVAVAAVYHQQPADVLELGYGEIGGQRCLSSLLEHTIFSGKTFKTL